MPESAEVDGLEYADGAGEGHLEKARPNAPEPVVYDRREAPAHGQREHLALPGVHRRLLGGDPAHVFGVRSGNLDEIPRRHDASRLSRTARKLPGDRGWDHDPETVFERGQIPQRVEIDERSGVEGRPEPVIPAALPQLRNPSAKRKSSSRSAAVRSG